MAGPGDLYGLCREYLDACIAALAGAPAGPIDRAFVSPGEPAFDCCPQLTVHCAGPGEANTAPLSPVLQPGHRIGTTGSVHLVQLDATVIRCVPVLEEGGDPPDGASIEAAAVDTLGDCWTIWNYVRKLVREDTLFTAPGGLSQREVIILPAVPVAIAGGCGGWVLPIQVQLGGYGG